MGVYGCDRNYLGSWKSSLYRKIQIWSFDDHLQIENIQDGGKEPFIQRKMIWTLLRTFW